MPELQRTVSPHSATSGGSCTLERGGMDMESQLSSLRSGGLLFRGRSPEMPVTWSPFSDDDNCRLSTREEDRRAVREAMLERVALSSSSEILRRWDALDKCRSIPTTMTPATKLLHHLNQLLGLIVPPCQSSESEEHSRRTYFQLSILDVIHI